MSTQNPTSEADIDTIIDTWMLMELRLSGELSDTDPVSIEISSDVAKQVHAHPLASYLESLSRYGDEVGIHVAVSPRAVEETVQTDVSLLRPGNATTKSKEES